MKSLIIFLAFVFLVLHSNFGQSDIIPLPEHPRPDFERAGWINLNGYWDFAFDKNDQGENNKWFSKQEVFNLRIVVPFPWGSKLSEIGDSANIGWYHKTINIPGDWDGKKVFLIVGASDWHNKLWIDGLFVGEYKGGYTPFEFDLTKHIKPGSQHDIVLKVDDSPQSFKLEGKQGYGNARGIWQTVYLEARGSLFFDYIHIIPDIDKSEIIVTGEVSEPAKKNVKIDITIQAENQHAFIRSFNLHSGDKSFTYSIPIDNQILWSLENPHLYAVNARLVMDSNITDEVNSYFGMRKISIINLPGTSHPYVALNNKPIYLQLALDQAYHPDGFYTFPSDDFIRDEIIRSKQIGLNGQRVHVKVPVPRKLYWADKLGHLIMADVPNSWGQPNEEMQSETETALRGMIKRDFNHPSIFSWVIFNETWGLFSTNESSKRQYVPGTQEWVESMYHLAKKLDPSRLVEDNSPCNYDHVNTDLNSWHAYLPGYEWKSFLDKVTDETYEGSSWNFAEGYRQKNQPNINSECGNVWGYEGSTGDIDWSWDYHIMINEFRKHPKIAGWLYTEHHDVINEWNGYYKFDRSNKITGLESFNGMSLNDLHNPIQITPDTDLIFEAKPGENITVPLWLSVFTDQLSSDEYIIKYYTEWVNESGNTYVDKYKYLPKIKVAPWYQGEISRINYRLPEQEGLLIMHIELSTLQGTPIHKNFVAVRIKGGQSGERSENLYHISFSPDSYVEEKWSQKQWNVLDGLKVNGTGYGHFSYQISIPENLNFENIEEAVFRIEISSKQLFGKDMDDKGPLSGDYMRGKGTFDPSRNPNAYPMTDENFFTSYARIKINNQVIKEVYLADDPADHRGILSWHAQPRDHKLREAGSYGYLVEAKLSKEIISEIMKNRTIDLRLEVPEINPGGLAIYGKDFGRYPLDPSFVFYLMEE